MEALIGQLMGGGGAMSSGGGGGQMVFSTGGHHPRDFQQFLSTGHSNHQSNHDGPGIPVPNG